MAGERTENPENESPGHILRDLRNRLALTLTELSQKTGLPTSTLSKLENDKMALSYDKIVKISAALDVDTSELFSRKSPVTHQPVFGRRVVNRGGEGALIVTDAYDSFHLASDILRKKIVPIFFDVKIRSIEEFGDLIRHKGEEFAYVVEGSIDFFTDCYAPTRLNQGDSVYFDSSIGHAYIAVGDGPCRVLSICSSDAAEIMSVSDRPNELHDHIRTIKD